jgi:predicted transcriptional regulator
VKELAKIARKHGRSVNYIVVKAIEAYVEKENG